MAKLNRFTIQQLQQMRVSEDNYPRRALHLVFEWPDLHKDELMENWERMENGETLVKINPLD